MFYSSENLLCDLILRPSPAARERAFGSLRTEMGLELRDLVPDVAVEAVYLSLPQLLDQRAEAHPAQRGDLLELAF